MSVTGNNMLDHSLLFISTAQTLQNQSIPIYIIVYLASHGLELLLKFFLRAGGEKDPKEFAHDIKKIYERLQEIFPSFPLNDPLVFRVHKNVERGGIRFYQQGVDYQKTSPREVMEYAVLLIDWWSGNPVISTLSNNLSWDNPLSSVLKFFRIKIMPENKSSNFGKLQRRLTFVMVFVLFFPTLISSLYGISSDPLSLTNTILSWGSFLTFFILIFFSIEIFERYLAYWVIKFINFLLLCEVVIFIPLFNIIAKYKTGPITSNLDYLVFSVSLFVMYALPFVMFVLLFLAGCYYSFKEFAKVKK
jgi:hypothetical protein